MKTKISTRVSEQFSWTGITNRWAASPTSTSLLLLLFSFFSPVQVWNPSTLEGVTADKLDWYFSSLEQERDLVLS